MAPAVAFRTLDRVAKLAFVGAIAASTMGCRRTTASTTADAGTGPVGLTSEPGFFERRWAERLARARDPIACSRPAVPDVPMPPELSPQHVRLRAACDGGKLDACADLGRLFRSGHGGPTDARVAAQLFARACTSEVTIGCVELAGLVREGFGLPENVACGDALTAWACAHGSPDACRAPVPTGRYRTARASIPSTTCEDGDYEACIDRAFNALQARLDAQYRAGQPQGSEFAPSEMQDLTRACLAGSERGCWALRPPQSDVMKRACAAGVMHACHPWDPRDGPGAPKPTHDDHVFACEHGVAEDCVIVGDEAKSPDAATKLYERACPPFASKDHERDVSVAGCARLAEARRRGRGGPRDLALALELATRACFGKELVHGVPDACFTLAEMLDAGEGTPPDPTAATVAAAMACSREPERCDVLAKRVAKGTGIAADPEHARRLFQTACKQGNKAACDGAAGAAPIDLGAFR